MSRSRRELSWPLYQKQLLTHSLFQMARFMFFVVFTTCILLKCDSWLTAISPLLRTLRSIHINSPPMTWTHWTSSIQRGPVTRDIFAEWKSHALGCGPFSSPSFHGAARGFLYVGFRFADEDTLLDCLLNVALWLRQARSCCSDFQCSVSVSTFPPALDCRQRKGSWNKNEFVFCRAYDPKSKFFSRGLKYKLNAQIEIGTEK